MCSALLFEASFLVTRLLTSSNPAGLSDAFTSFSDRRSDALSDCFDPSFVPLLCTQPCIFCRKASVDSKAYFTSSTETGLGRARSANSAEALAGRWLPTATNKARELHFDSRAVCSRKLASGPSSSSATTSSNFSLVRASRAEKISECAATSISRSAKARRIVRVVPSSEENKSERGDIL